jgi:hypothetical protein
MKKTDLEKNKALKLMGQLKQAGTPGRLVGTPASDDRRERRKQEQAQGLVPFAVKLPQSLADALRQRAAAQDENLNELVARLLEAGLQDK